MSRMKDGLRALVSAAVLGLMGASSVAGQTLAELTAALPSGISVIETLDRYMFVDADGMALYILDDDRAKPGVSTCEYGGLARGSAGLAPHCAWRWPPLFAPADAKPIGDWSVIKRPAPEDKWQWAYKNMPVYLYEEDLRPGFDSGDNAGQRWHTLAVARPVPKPLLPTGVKVQKGETQWLLADQSGRLLYALAEKKKLKDTGCTADCAGQWQSFSAPMIAQPIGDWTVVKNADGTKQWAYKGQPLYLYGKPGAPEPQALSVLSVVVAQDQRS